MASTEKAPPDNDVASPGKNLFKKYELGKLLGCGGFAKVYHARDLTTNQSVAIKIIEKNRLSDNIQRMCNIKREISIMRRLNHPNILKLHEVLATKTKIYFVLEFAKNGELFARVAKSRLSEDVSRRYFQQLISAVGYCHGEGVYHRDLKPENLLLDENNDLKVSDFGLSALKTEQVRDDGRLHTLCGTPAYVAPEVLSRKGYDGDKVDVWSCGVVLFVMVAGYLPFNDPNLMNLYRKIYKGEYRCPKSISSELKRFLSRVLDTNPETRITVDEIKKDPWFLHGFDQEIVNGAGFNNDQYEKKIMHGGGGKEMIMNAFDIVALFSKGLDLKGLFLEGSTSDKAVVVVERVVADGSPETVMERVAAENGDGAVSMVTNYWECGVVVLGQNGDVAGEVEVYRLTDTLSVVEAKRIVGKELGDLFCEWWSGVRAVVLGQKVAGDQ